MGMPGKEEWENKVKRILLIPTNQVRTQINPHGIPSLLVGMVGIVTVKIMC
jgi:hypothetical protein